MTKDELKQAAADAWQCVLAHPAADIKNYLMGQGIIQGDGETSACMLPAVSEKKLLRAAARQGGRMVV